MLPKRIISFTRSLPNIPLSILRGSESRLFLEAFAEIAGVAEAYGVGDL